MNKNETCDLEIIDNGMNFEGIAKKDDFVIFVPGAIVEEKVHAKIIKKTKSYMIAKVDGFLKKSRYREEPFCAVYKYCGGCDAQHISYDMQLVLKNNMVKEVLKKQGVSYKKLENIIGMGLPLYYRNKVQYPVREINGISKIGFYQKRSHDIIENNCCYIQNRVIDILAKDVFEALIKKGFKGYNEKTGKGDIRHILIRRGFHTQEIMVVLVINNEDLFTNQKLKDIAIEYMKKNEHIKCFALNLNVSNTNEILGSRTKVIAGVEYISDIIGEYKYYISSKSFFQVNTQQAEVLYNVLKSNLELNNSDILFDLYSGVGSIGIFLSKEVQKVYGIEIEKDAVKMANLNIKENGITNAEYIAGSVEDKIKEFKERNINPSVIVVDPPRKGLDEKSIDYIINFRPKKIGYVSCNPATLARDLKALNTYYDVISITPVDMFPFTKSIENVAILNLKNM